MKSLHRGVQGTGISSERYSSTLLVLIIALALILSACSSGVEQAQAEIQLHDLTDIEDLRVAFNQDTGQPRIILLLSPT